ncbi:hypothetical protein SAMN04487968_109184 [Nocardioides terrae]|uniref:Histidine kinase-like ATPase domain-containing protein n=1 Tax=Nocardioides terrae TaxID=574651 RepID=A0A1I1L7B8_9ACTN|nr:hypothetical protein SAMN04487968_109184 [Nocardioides terrae]
MPAEALHVALVLTSELVTNAVRYGNGRVGLQVVWDSRSVRIDVADQSPERPVVRVVDDDATQGRGMLLVDALSSSWGGASSRARQDRVVHARVLVSGWFEAAMGDIGFLRPLEQELDAAGDQDASAEVVAAPDLESRAYR